MEPVTTISLHPEQWRAYNFKKQYGVAICGTKGGKTFVGATWANKKIVELPLGSGLIAAPTIKILQQATLDTFFNLFPEYRKFHKKQEGVIELPTGGRIYIRSTDEPLAIEGFNLDWAWLDEIGMMSRLAWVIAKGKVAISHGQIFGTTNAYYMNWLYKEVYLPSKEGHDPEVELFNWSSIDNPYFPKEFADKERDRMSPAEFSRRYEGKFVRMEGLVWNVDDSNILKRGSELDSYLTYPERIIAGIDWGYTNPAAILVINIKDNKYYVTTEWKEVKRTSADIIQKCSELNREALIQTFYPDPAEPDRLDEMRRAGMTVGEVNKDIPMGISKVETLLREHRLFILEDCKELLDEVTQYRYENPKEDHSGKEVPMKVNDHLCDALRYAIVGNEFGQNLTFQEEKGEKMRIEQNRNSRKEYELL